MLPGAHICHYVSLTFFTVNFCGSVCDKSFHKRSVSQLNFNRAACFKLVYGLIRVRKHFLLITLKLASSFFNDGNLYRAFRILVIKLRLIF